jgi:hypothetical protein
VQTFSTQVEPDAHVIHAAVQLAPDELLGAQIALAPVPHRWKLALQAGTQEVPLQVTVPLAGATQVAQEAPHASTVLFATQVGACAVPRWQKPGVLQTTRQLSVPGVAMLSQAAMPLLGGAGHAAQELPHVETLRSGTQVPVPVGQR